MQNHLFYVGSTAATVGVAVLSTINESSIQLVERFGSFGLVAVGGLCMIGATYLAVTRGLPAVSKAFFDYLHQQRVILSEERQAFLAELNREREQREEQRDLFFQEMEKNNNKLVEAIKVQTRELRGLKVDKSND